MSSIKAKFLLFSLLFLCLGAIDSLGQVEEVGASNSLFYYTGSLGTNEQLEFNMQLNGHAISGSCILVTSGNLYVIKGRLAADKSGMGVLVYDESDQFIASVEAKVISDEFDFAKEIKKSTLCKVNYIPYGFIKRFILIRCMDKPEKRSRDFAATFYPLEISH